jgi:hypothetical protein
MAWRVFKLFASQTPFESLNSPDLVGYQYREVGVPLSICTQSCQGLVQARIAMWV